MMNTAIRTLTAPSHIKLPQILNAPPRFVTIILSLAVMFSGLSVVYMSDLNRRMTTAVEDAHAQTLYLETEWDKLLLERSTWSSQSRVQQIAVNSFNMVEPNAQEVITLRLES